MSFYTSLDGIANAQTELGVVSNNLANAQTTGFKESRVNFADIVAGSSSADPKLTEGIGSQVQSIQQQFSSGSIEQTGSSTDFALDGNGFFTVKSAASGNVTYTRNGAFTLDASGYLVDASGNRLQVLASGASTPSDAQAPTVNAAGSPFANISLGSDGTLTAAYADGTTQAVGKIAVAGFVSPTGLLPIGDQSWQATGLSGTATYNAPGIGGAGSVLSGSLEQSNVDVSAELVNLITAQQYFQANSKAISTTSQTLTYIMNATQG